MKTVKELNGDRLMGAAITCQRCGSERIADVGAKCSDCCFLRVGDGREHDGYVPGGLGIGGGDYVEFYWCLECGQIQGDAFPVPQEAVEEAFE